ncbi:MAG TPA: hypothetical protein VNC50_00100 [Planctomycetia bacterium]|nr:hypothetical protein [Planctomycetia bacterium]
MIAALVVLAMRPLAHADGYDLPERVKVLPVIFAPTDQQAPLEADQKLFLRHLEWTRKRYGEMLIGDSFELAKPTVTIVRGKRPLSFYRQQPENGAPEVVAELLSHFKTTRFNCPYVFCTLMANAKDGYPVGGGRPINGGLNSGAGFLFISSSEVRRNKHFQTTLQHEIGHAFGLPHPDVYGYDLKTNPSIMSYSKANYTDGFTPAKQPGILIPEDRRALALNDRVFANTTFDPKKHVSRGSALFPKFVPLGPMTLPDNPDFYPSVTTDAGEAVRSKVANTVMGEIKPSKGPGITYDAKNMWHSDKLIGRPAKLTFTFPFEVVFDGMAIHSQHSGLDHAATAMKLEAEGGKRFAEKKLNSIDATVTFPKARGREFTLTLEPGKSRILVVRGIRFLNGGAELFPRMIPGNLGADASSD